MVFGENSIFSISINHKKFKNMKKCLRSHKLWQDKNYSSKPVLNKIGAKIGTLQKTSTFCLLFKQGNEYFTDDVPLFTEKRLT
jgi:hypothetical protein